MAFWEQLVGQIKGLLAGLNTRDRALFIGGAVAIGSGLLYALFWFGGEGFEPVSATQFDLAEQAKAVQELALAGIPARVEGSLVQVPKGRLAEARMQLARKEAMPVKKYGFYQLISNQPFPGTREQETNRLIALQFVLEEAIATIQGVDSARVIINPGDATPSVFLAERDIGKPTASVLLRLSVRDRLSEETVQGVRNLVSGAWKGLQPADVKVSDTKGRVYDPKGRSELTQANSLLTLQQLTEDYCVQKIQSLFGSMPGVVAVVNARLKANEVERQINSVKPDEIATLFSKTVEDRKEHEGTGSAPVGVASNLGSEASNRPESAKLTDIRTEEEVKNDVTRIMERIIEKPGEVATMSVAVTIPRRLDEAAFAKGETKFLPVPAESLANFKKLVMRACGIENQENVEVMDIDPPAGFYEPPEPWWKGFLREMARRPAQWILGLAAVLAVVGLYRIARGASPEMEKTVEERAAQQKIPQVKLPDLSAEEQMEGQVKVAVEKNPQLAAGLIKRWLLEDR